ncbi:MAG: DNA primase [Paludibacteraceae bacterium]|nr:DNA primase [Paludibacteraceae bacterium]MBR1381515.1 DNA primase [Paludibacteraceae bacterium]
MIPRDVIEHIFSAAKIEEVVSDYVTLRKRGANLIGLCPFHNEKTGSFTVSPSKGIYKCFGCGVSGNAVGFVMAMEQCSFADAIKQLGKKYHIEVPERQMTAEEQQRQDDRESMFVVNDFANKWFQEQLWETKEGQAIGLSYFRERGLRDDIIRKYQLGYSPEKGSPLAAALKKKGFSERFILNDVDTKIGVGVVGKSEDGRIYDRFRDRVMFPIFTVSGKPVAFAGRILKKKDNVGKYVNSPDSLIYSKTNELYGLFQAKQAISRADRCYLVEGQMDVISMFQSGIENVVASGGTALTKPQIRLIQRFTSNITVLYDGDAAGIHAALRGIDMFLEEGFNVKVVLLPDGEDPDSFAQSHDSTEFIQYIEEHQTDFIRFKMALLSKEAGDDPYKRAALIKDITSSIAIIPDIITRQVYIKDCSDRLHMSEKVLTTEVVNLRRKKIEEHNKAKEREAEQAATTVESTAESTETTATPVNPTSPVNPTPIKAPKSALDQNFYNLMQLVVRYGERPIQVGDTIYSIGEIIIYTLEEDEIKAPEPVYQAIIDEFKRHCKDEGFKAEDFFKFHPDQAISALAIDMIAEKYQYASFNHEGRLGELVTQFLYEIKLTVINQQIEELEQNLKEAQASGNWDRQMQLLAYQPQLLQARNDLCKLLGNRVINV